MVRAHSRYIMSYIEHLLKFGYTRLCFVSRGYECAQPWLKFALYKTAKCKAN